MTSVENGFSNDNSENRAHPLRNTFIETNIRHTGQARRGGGGGETGGDVSCFSHPERKLEKKDRKFRKHHHTIVD